MAQMDDLLKMDVDMGGRTNSQVDLSWLLPDTSSSYPAQDYSSAMINGWKDETFVINPEDLGENAKGIDDLAATLVVEEEAAAPDPVASGALTSTAIPLYFDSDAGKAASFLYSAQLNTLFVAINSPFPLIFPPLAGLASDARIYISTPFSRAEHVLNELPRCPNHAEEFATAKPVDRLLLCDHSAAEYITDPTTGNPCVTMPYANGTPIVLRLMCFSSCTGSIRRRPIHVLARIVTSAGEQGHATIPVRVCACPKRDLKAAERAAGPQMDMHKRGPLAEDAFQTLEVVGTANDDNKVYTVTATSAEALLVAQRVAEALHAVQRPVAAQPCDGVKAFLEGLGLGGLFDRFAAGGYDDLELLEHLDEKVYLLCVSLESTHERTINCSHNHLTASSHSCLAGPARDRGDRTKANQGYSGKLPRHPG
eukprot:m.21160 g.21160  ORF g.21160 m.21160 type:complete len:424 (+) comp8013_c0_seq1:53-1324(+)